MLWFGCLLKQERPALKKSSLLKGSFPTPPQQVMLKHGEKEIGVPERIKSRILHTEQN